MNMISLLGCYVTNVEDGRWIACCDSTGSSGSTLQPGGPVH